MERKVSERKAPQVNEAKIYGYDETKQDYVLTKHSTIETAGSKPRQSTPSQSPPG